MGFFGRKKTTEEKEDEVKTEPSLETVENSEESVLKKELESEVEGLYSITFLIKSFSLQIH